MKHHNHNHDPKHDPALWPHCLETCADHAIAGCGLACKATTCPVELYEQRTFNDENEENASERRAFSEEDARNQTESARRTDPYQDLFGYTVLHG